MKSARCENIATDSSNSQYLDGADWWVAIINKVGGVIQYTPLGSPACAEPVNDKKVFVKACIHLHTIIISLFSIAFK